MKRALGLTCAVMSLLMLSLPTLSAGENNGKCRFIVKGGFNYTGVSGLRDVESLNLGEYSGFNIGGAVQIDLPLAFSIQPEILYYRSGAKTDISVSGYGTVDGRLYNGNIYIPVNVQWGPKMGLFRVYAQVSPFIGFAMSNRLQYTDPDDGLKTIKVLTGDTNIFMGGLGAGVGFEVWKLQLSVKYNWNFNKLFKSDASIFAEYFQEARMRGLEISLGFMF